MIAGYQRTAAAFVLATAAVALPSLAWYVAGSREHSREAGRLEEDARCDARDGGRRLAASLAARLESLRRTESRRPYYHYQNLYHDPNGAHDGPSIIPSPLAEGPVDPLVRAHFQVAPDGRIGLPTINAEVPELNIGLRASGQARLLDLLRACGDGCRLGDARPAAVDWRQATGTVEPASFGPPDGAGDRGAWRKIWIDETSWIQNREASEIYVDLRGWDGSEHCTVIEQAVEAARRPERVAIEIGPFHWRTVPIGSHPELAALRAVRTPDGTFTQGWIVDRARVLEWLARLRPDADFAPAGTTGMLEAVLPMHGAEWAVAVDEAGTVASVRRDSARDLAEFRTRFGLAVGAAWVVGLGVVGLVWQSERLAQQRSRFAASAAHELRTPLAGLRMYGEMLAEGLGDPERSRDYARRIASESERLGRVVSNVLGFARLERGLFDVRPRPGDLSAAVLECTRGQRRALESAGVTLRMDLPEGLPEARFDPDALCHVLQNLLDNAEKYTRGAADRTVTVRVEARDGAFGIVVADRGPGVSTSDVHRLFRPFSRGRDADAPAGVGLGLVLSRALARAMGGDLRYEPRDGGGSRFVLRLPA
jgi:signal transduction histidine kinase